MADYLNTFGSDIISLLIISYVPSNLASYHSFQQTLFRSVKSNLHLIVSLILQFK